jgi:hypothetical protein
VAAIGSWVTRATLAATGDDSSPRDRAVDNRPDVDNSGGQDALAVGPVLDLLSDDPLDDEPEEVVDREPADDEELIEPDFSEEPDLSGEPDLSEVDAAASTRPLERLSVR